MGMERELMFILGTRMTWLRFLFRCGMDGGLMAINIVQYVEKINLEGLMPMYGQIGNQIIAPTAVLRWTEVLTDGC